MFERPNVNFLSSIVTSNVSVTVAYSGLRMTILNVSSMTRLCTSTTINVDTYYKHLIKWLQLHAVLFRRVLTFFIDKNDMYAINK